jgi:hypothetical protein
VEDIVFFILGNNCTGTEDIGFYESLKPRIITWTGTQHRQIREMLVFISQFSFLKMFNGELRLDIVNDSAYRELETSLLVPIPRVPNTNKITEYFEMTSLESSVVVPTLEVFTTNYADIEFIEGKRKRVEHFKIERSPLLRKFYMMTHDGSVCDACSMDTRGKYPWTEFMLDIHHLLPLSSSVSISTEGTSLDDIVGLCPTCHRAIHVYYRNWLKSNGKDDFASKQEAHDIYEEAAGYY